MADIHFSTVLPTVDPLRDDSQLRNPDRTTAAAATTLPPVVESQPLPGSAVTAPSLPAPAVSTTALPPESFGVLPSPGARLMAFLGELLDEQRRLNTEARLAQTLDTVAKMREEADQIRSQAKANLAMGIVSAAIQMGVGATTTGLSARALHQGKTPAVEKTDKAISKALDKTAAKPEPTQTAQTADAERTDRLQARTLTIRGISDALSSTSAIVDTTKGFTQSQHDALIKDLDAQLEIMRTLAARLDALNDSFKDVILKARQTQDAIQQSTNQTRTKILG